MQETIELKKQEDGSFKLEMPGTDVAELKQGIMAGIAKTEVFGIPLGAAAGGLLTASVWDAIAGFVGGVVPGLPLWVTPAVGALVTKRWLSRFMGTDAANAGALILTADAIQQFFNLRGLISGIIKPATAAQRQENVVTQAEKVAKNYYPGIASRVG